jgi:nucleotide-binding universal stress UspA family protein
MNRKMKLLIAYDGSESSVALPDELRRAGLPREAEALVVSVAETWWPLPTSFGGVETGFTSDGLTGVAAARTLAEVAAERIRSDFPGWRVQADAASGSVAGVLIGKADEWEPDLIVLGSQGHTALGRFFLGSVSQAVVNQARCSVRVARVRAGEPPTERDAPVRLLIGVDGSAGAEAAVEAVAARQWPAGSEARVVNAFQAMPPGPELMDVHEHIASMVADWLAGEKLRIGKTVDQAAAKLQTAGLLTSSVVKEGNPKQLLISEAESWRADCLFVGARGLNRLERLWLGSVSTAVVTRAHCSVEVVRSAQLSTSSS